MHGNILLAIEFFIPTSSLWANPKLSYFLTPATTKPTGRTTGIRQKQTHVVGAKIIIERRLLGSRQILPSLSTLLPRRESRIGSPHASLPTIEQTTGHCGNEIFLSVRLFTCLGNTKAPFPNALQGSSRL